MTGTSSLRARTAYVLWHAHPARPGRAHRALLESQWWPTADIRALQLQRLRGLVRAAASIPFYRERFHAAGVSPGDLRTIADLRRLPVLERDDVERLGVAGLKRPGSWGMRVSTSGSLGRPVQVLWPLDEMRWRDASEARAHGWMGSAIGERRLEVRCRPVGLPQAVSARLLNAEAVHAPSVVHPGVVDALLQAVERRPPTLVWGVSNALYVVARALMQRGARAPVRACWSGGNHLHPHYRRALAEAFQTEVYERYATIENGVVAHECTEARTMHVAAEGIIAEVVREDGAHAEPGETGDILLTSLCNPATPLIRYRVGDRGIAPDEAPCPCGRGLPRFGAVVGRAPDVLRLPGGRVITVPELMAALEPVLDRLVDLQAVQSADGAVRVKVVQPGSDDGGDVRSVVGRIVGGLTGRPVAVERVSALDLTPGGKLRTIVPAG